MPRVERGNSAAETFDWLDALNWSRLLNRLPEIQRASAYSLTEVRDGVWQWPHQAVIDWGAAVACNPQARDPRPDVRIFVSQDAAAIREQLRVELDDYQRWRTPRARSHAAVIIHSAHDWISLNCAKGALPPRPAFPVPDLDTAFRELSLFFESLVTHKVTEPVPLELGANVGADADGKTDGRKKTKKILPENNDVIRFAKYVRTHDGEGIGQERLAQQFIDEHDVKGMTAASMVRKLRDYPNLMNT